MKHVWTLTAVAALYGLANGLLINATPQAGLLALHFNSTEIGRLGAGIPIGYAVSCLLFFQLSRWLPGKYVLLSGVLGALLSTLAMTQARTPDACFAAQAGFGVASGAFWPFLSSWLLDFQSERITKTRLLRQYNVAWTSGSATGMLLAGLLCERGLIYESMYGCAAVLAVVFVAACLPRAPRAASPAADTLEAPGDGARPASMAARIAFPLVVAAATANLAALGTRTMILNNYPELNRAMHYGADRMGLFTALSLLSQLVFFSIGSVYEHWLGLRRVYVFLACSLVAINLAFAWTGNLVILLGAVTLHGLVLAMAFQKGIIAATGYFSSPRTGTTFHEAVIGTGGVASLFAGQFITRLKDSGLENEAALRAPFFLMAGAVLVALVLQLVLVSLRNGQRVLLRKPAATGET
ncbi:MAG: hypothetical protein NTW87_37160 [Planctomycetota bacterium]|nr:hypothetical protein [Planctomycetota bacterium]